jgi:hypothetical protein
MGEKPGVSAPPMLTPTPPSPVEGEGTAQRLTVEYVPSSIDPPPSRWRERFEDGANQIPTPVG